MIKQFRQDENKNMPSVPLESAKVQKIGAAQIATALETLRKYKEGKAQLENRVVANEQWYKLRHWEQINGRQKGNMDPEPTSAWLFNSLANKHADAMDNYPSPNILPREEGDKEEAKKLSAIIPVVLMQNDFEATYSDVWWDKIKSGTGVYGVFWNNRKLNGLGDIDIKQIDILNLYWEPGVMDIQDSRNIFNVELMDNDILEQRYLQLRGKLGTTATDVKTYIYDDTVDTSNKSLVVDWYYRADNGSKEVLHYCKFVNDAVLYASENDENYAERGYYDHAQYPFIFDTMFVNKGTPSGFGYIDVMRSPQLYIDKLNRDILKNAAAAAKPRYFVRDDSSINEKEFMDLNNDIVHVTGNLGDDQIKPINASPLSSIYVNILQMKIEELKETSGNRDFSQGGTSNGVTAASAISALMEAGSKLSRDMIKASYRTHSKICYFVIELIRQFYDEPRCFRITGEMGKDEYSMYDNRGLQMQTQGQAFGVDMGYRLPVFDINVIPQKSSPYSKMAQNELALQFYQYGFFNPQMADQALTCLNMMDFDGKDGIMQRISQNGTLLQMVQQLGSQLLQLAQIVDAQNGSNMTQQIVMQLQQISQSIGVQIAPQGGDPNLMQNNPLGEAIGAGQTSTQKKTTEKAANQASPR